MHACVQRGRKAKEAGEGAPKAPPQWKVSEVRGLEEALLQHGEGRTATTRRAVSALSFLRMRKAALACPKASSAMRMAPG